MSLVSPIPFIETWKEIESKRKVYFRVEFRRKTDKKVDGMIVARRGEVRMMIARLFVKEFINSQTGEGWSKTAQETIDEDQRCQVKTVWDLEVYRENRRAYRRIQAGRSSYRRINLPEVLALKVLTPQEVREYFNVGSTK